MVSYLKVSLILVSLSPQFPSLGLENAAPMFTWRLRPNSVFQNAVDQVPLVLSAKCLLEAYQLLQWCVAHAG
jgi:hypothetical protein